MTFTVPSAVPIPVPSAPSASSDRRAGSDLDRTVALLVIATSGVRVPGRSEMKLLLSAGRGPT